MNRLVATQCVCCQGEAHGRYSGSSTWGPVRVICHRCNVGKCGRGETTGRSSDVASWRCVTRVGLPILRYQGVR